MNIAGMTIDEVGEAIGIPRDKWGVLERRDIVHGIINAGLVRGVPAVGHYRGDISVTGILGAYASVGFVPHIWIYAWDQIVDPTQWLITSSEPRISVVELVDGRCPYYDEGGNIWRNRQDNPCPAASIDSSREVKLHMNESMALFVRDACQIRDPEKHPTEAQLFWLANLPPEQLGWFAASLYYALRVAGLGAFIPIDNERMVLRESRARLSWRNRISATCDCEADSG